MYLKVNGVRALSVGLVLAVTVILLAALWTDAISGRAVAASDTGPFWVNDLHYGSVGGGFYWDPVSGNVWTSERAWHVFRPEPSRPVEPLWVNLLTYGSIGGGFYWDPQSGQVWTSERGWHLFNQRTAPPLPTPPPRATVFPRPSPGPDLESCIGTTRLRAREPWMVTVDCTFSGLFDVIVSTDSDSVADEGPRIRVTVTDPHGRATTDSGYYFYALQKKRFSYPFNFATDRLVTGTYTIEVRVDLETICRGSVVIR